MNSTDGLDKFSRLPAQLADRIRGGHKDLLAYTARVKGLVKLAPKDGSLHRELMGIIADQAMLIQQSNRCMTDLDAIVLNGGVEPKREEVREMPLHMVNHVTNAANGMPLFDRKMAAAGDHSLDPEEGVFAS